MTEEDGAGTRIGGGAGAGAGTMTEEDGAGTRIGGGAGAGSRGSGPDPVTVPGLPNRIRSRAELRAGPEPNRAEPGRAAAEPALTINRL
jgi:hypothetical protein